MMPLETFNPSHRMNLVRAGNGAYVRRADHEQSLKDTGFIDRHGVRIYEGNKVNFSTRGHPHGPEREDYQNQTVFWDQWSGSWLFGLSCEIGMVDGIMRETLEVVPNA